MKKLSGFLFGVMLLTSNTVINSQAPDWTRILQSPSVGVQNANVITADNNFVYMAGVISGPFTFGGAGLNSIGKQDMIVSKITNSGIFSWTRQVSAGVGSFIIPYAIALDAFSNTYISGVFSGSVTLGSGTVTSDALNNSFLAKFDANGNGIWISSFMATGVGNSKIAVDDGENVYLISKTNKLIKFNNVGLKLWEQEYPMKTLQSIAVKGTNLFIGGALQPGITSFNPYNLEGLSPNTAFIARADLDGVFNKTLVESTTSFSTKDGDYHAVGTRIHPTAGTLPIDVVKTVSGSSENVLSTTVGDLTASFGYVILTIDPATDSVTISGLIGTQQPVYASGINFYDPGTKTFTLHYSYDAVGGGNARIISEVLTKQSDFVPGQSAISDMAFDINGDMILTGGFTQNLALDTISVNNTAASNYTFVAKCNSNLEFAWIKPSQKFSSAQLFNFKIFLDAANNIYESAPVTNSSFTYGSVTVPATNGQFVVQFDAGGNAMNAYAVSDNTFNRFYVTPDGKYICIGSYNYAGAPSYGNLFVDQYFSNMSLEWRQSSTGITSGSMQMNYVKHDPAGNLYVQARIIGYYDYFGTIINSNSYVTIIAKHDNTGKLLWLKQISDKSPQVFGTSFTLDKDNNVLMAGLFNTSLTIGSTTLTTTNTGDEGYVVKYSSNGDFLWAAKMNLSTNVTNYITLTTDNSGNVIVSGVINPSNYLVKFDPSGNQLWAKTIPMDSYYMALVSTDAGNNIYLASEIHTSAPIMIGSVQLTQTLEDGATVLVKFDLNGNALWAKTYGGIIGANFSDGWPCAIRNDAAGNTFLWGTFKNNAIFGASTLTNPFSTYQSLKQDYSYFVTKINPSGGVLWVKPIFEKVIGFNYGDLMDLDKSGNVYVGGHFKDSISINGSIYKPEGLNDFFMTKYSGNGDFQWISTIPSNSEIIRTLSVLKDDVVTITGNAGIKPTLGSKAIITGSGPTSIIASLGSMCYAQFDYTWTGAINFTDQSVGNPTAWSWDFGDGTYSAEQNPVHSYTKAGTYTVSLTTINQTSNCVASVSRKVTAGAMALCQSDFDFNLDPVSGKTSFTSKSLDATEYYWNFGDGIFSTEMNPSHIYAKAGIYPTCLTIMNSTNGCQSVSCKDLIYIPTGENYIQGDFSYYINPEGTSVTFNDLSSSNTTDWYWTFGDGKVSKIKDPVYTYSKPGIYNVCLTVFDILNSLSQSVCKEVRVGSTLCTLRSDFSYFINPVAREVDFFNESKGIVSSYFWTFGDGSSSAAENPRHYFAVPGIYSITLMVRNNVENCIDKFSQVIQVGSVDCRAGFTYNIDATTGTAFFRDDSKGGIDYYYWDMGDGAFSVLKDPDHLYKKAGIYMVGQTVIDNTNGCMDFTVQPIQLGEINCAADFITYVDSLNYTAYFTNRTLGESTSFLWSFGDGRFSTEQNPVHVFPGEGLYSAGLNTYNFDNGCMDYYEEMLIIGGIGKDCEADFIYIIDQGNTEVSFKNNSLGNISGSVWNFGDQTDNSYEMNPVHKYSEPGYYNVCLGVINTEGIKNMNCKWVLVQGDNSNDCLANFMFTIDSANLKVNFADNSFGNIDSYSWDFGDSKPDSVSNLPNPEHTYNQKGYYMVRLKVENTVSNCNSKGYKLLNVGELQVLKAAFSYEAYEPGKKVSGYPVDLVSASSGDGATVEWDFGDKDVKKGPFNVMDSTSLRVTHYYKNSGKYTVCLRIKDPISNQTDTYCSLVSTTFGVNVDEESETKMNLKVYPNPFDDYTTINYTLPQTAFVQMEIFDQLGRRIQTLVKSKNESGDHQLVFESKNLRPGIYNLKMVTDAGVISKQLVITR